MVIGIPKEIKKDEHRVALVPAAVRTLAARGHSVLVEPGAGEGIGAADCDYRQAGAQLADTVQDLYAAAEMVVKVKEPQPQEYTLLRPGQMLFCYLHLAADRRLTQALLEREVTAIGFETVTDEHGRLPLLAPMSQVAGRLSVQLAAHLLEKHVGGPGLLLGGVPGVPACRVVVLGGGVAGTEAARMAAGLGAEVVVLDNQPFRLAELDQLFAGRVRTRYSDADAVAEELRRADVTICSVLIPGAVAPHLVTRQLVAQMRKGSLIVDLSIDQGGCCETSRPTTHSNPSYVVEGVIHSCVTNLPGAVPRTSSLALSNAVLPCALALAGNQPTPLRERVFRTGLNTIDGRLVSKAVAESLGLPYEVAGPGLAA
jgi:alanine dehydrogenase